MHLRHTRNMTGSTVVQSRPDIYISADVETDGPIPGPYSMLSFGFSVAGRFDGSAFTRSDPTASTFYRELRPISPTWDPETASFSGLDRSVLLVEGHAPSLAMDEAARWVRDVSDGARPVLVAFPMSFDWMWLYWYFVTYASDGSPFRFSDCFDVKTAYALVNGSTYDQTSRKDMPAWLRSPRPHTHNAREDAIEQADIFANLFESLRDVAADPAR